jgi:hypothetical protein
LKRQYNQHNQSCLPIKGPKLPPMSKLASRSPKLMEHPSCQKAFKSLRVKIPTSFLIVITKLLCMPRYPFLSHFLTHQPKKPARRNMIPSSEDEGAAGEHANTDDVPPEPKPALKRKLQARRGRRVVEEEKEEEHEDVEEVVTHEEPIAKAVVVAKRAYDDEGRAGTGEAEEEERLEKKSKKSEVAKEGKDQGKGEGAKRTKGKGGKEKAAAPAAAAAAADSHDDDHDLQNSGNCFF